MGLGSDSFPSADVHRIAALAYQLPPKSRVMSAIAPTDANGTEIRLLREIEYNQRLWHWANTKDAQNKETAPDPITLPGEEEAHEEAVADAERKALRAAERLGIKL